MDDSLSRIGEALVALPVELGSRRRHDRPAEIHYVKGREHAPGLPGGSICVVSGLAGAPFLKEVRAAARGGEAGAVAKVLSAHEAQLSKHATAVTKRAQEHPVAQAIAEIPAITEVSYRGKAVAEGMIVHSELQAMRVLVPYAGGRLDPSGFVASTYVRGRKAPDVESVIVVREPELTAIERKVLDELPEEINQLVIGDPGVVANWGLAAAGLVFVVVVVGGVLLAKYAKEQIEKHEREHEKEVERQLEGQQEQHQAQEDAGERQQNEGQQERQAEGQGEGQQEHQGEGQGEQEHQANSGNLGWFIDEAELQGDLEGLVAGAAVQTLVQLRATLMMQGQLR